MPIDYLIYMYICLLIIVIKLYDRNLRLKYIILFLEVIL